MVAAAGESGCLLMERQAPATTLQRASIFVRWRLFYFRRGQNGKMVAAQAGNRKNHQMSVKNNLILTKIDASHRMRLKHIYKVPLLHVVDLESRGCRKLKRGNSRSYVGEPM